MPAEYWDTHKDTTEKSWKEDCEYLRRYPGDLSFLVDKWGGSTFKADINHPADGHEMVMLAWGYNSVLFRYKKDYDDRGAADRWDETRAVEELSKAIASIWNPNDPKFGDGNRCNWYGSNWIRAGEISLVKAYKAGPLTPKEQKNQLFRGLWESLVKVTMDYTERGVDAKTVLGHLKGMLHNISQFTPLYKSKYHSNLKNKKIPCQIVGLTQQGFLIKLLSDQKISSMGRDSYGLVLIDCNPEIRGDFNFWLAREYDFAGVL